MKNKIDEQSLEEIIGLRSYGKSYKEISNLLGIPKTTLFNAVKKKEGKSGEKKAVKPPPSIRDILISIEKQTRRIEKLLRKQEKRTIERTGTIVS